MAKYSVDLRKLIFGRMLLNFLYLAAGLILLTWSADRFIAAAASLVRHWGVSPMLIGVFVLGIGTSAPEIAVSISAALRGTPDIALGNAIGSNITNIGLVLGICAAIRVLPVTSSALRSEFPAVMLVSVLLLLICADDHYAQYEGIGLLILFIGVMGWLVWRGSHAEPGDPLIEEIESQPSAEMSLKPAVAWLIFGLIGLPVSADLFVTGASGIAREMGVSELVIGLTIVAFGTSLPELAASLSSALRGEVEMALGNVLGSNLFNALIVFGVPGALQSIELAPEVLRRDLPMMLALTAAIYLLAKLHNSIGRLAGLGLIGSFIAYLSILAL